MPGTASSQLHSRTSAKVRPSAATRAANLIANTPVLFRLPAIQHIPAQTAPPAVASEVGANVAMQIEAVAQSHVAPQPQSVTPAKTIMTDEALVKPEQSTAPDRSWWEHWSSGVVLIVLLIALATASVLALKGRGQGEPKYIADVDKSQSVSSNSLDTLSNIEVPSIPSNASGQAPQVAQEVDRVAATSPQSLPQPAVVEQAVTPNSGSLALQPTTSLIPNDSLVLTSDSATSRPSRTFLGVDISKFATAGTANVASNDESKTAEQPLSNSEDLVLSHATASLDTPVGVQAPRLFDDATTTPRPSNVTATPASNSTPTPNSGASPNFYDSSSTMLATPAASQLDATSLKPPSASQPSTPTIPVSASTSVAVGSTESGDSLIIGEQDIARTQSTSPSNPAIRATATPEFNREQLFKAYQDFTRVPTPGQNRYQPQFGSSAPTTATQQNPTASSNSQPSATQNPAIQNPATQYNAGNAAGQVAGGSTNITLPYLNPQVLNATNPQQYPPYNPQPNAAQPYANQALPGYGSTPTGTVVQQGYGPATSGPAVSYPPANYDPALYNNAPNTGAATTGPNTASGYGIPSQPTYR